MDLDELAIELHTREGPEAIDLGMAISRQFWWAMLGPWLLVVGGVFALAATAAALAPTLPAAGLFAAIPWLLKPAFDRIPLFVVSRAVFGEVPSFGRTLRHAGSRWTSMPVVFDCTVRRLSPYRSLTMPIRELERLDDEQYGERKSALLRHNVQWPAIALTGIGLAAELVVVLGLLAALAMVLPSGSATGVPVDLASLEASSEFVTVATAIAMAVYFVAVTLVELFYVGAGYGLYINRRIDLEGWDVELTFRRMARRFADRPGRRAAGLVVAGGLAALAFTFGGAPVATAASPPASTPDPSASDPARQTERGEPAQHASRPDPQATVDEILEAPEFGHTEKQWTWELRDFDERERSERPDWVGELLGTLGGLFELLLWVAAGIGVGAFAYVLIRRVAPDDGTAPERRRSSPPEPDPRERPAASPEMSLPTDLVREASRRWEAGEPLASLSLLYRGTLEGLEERYAIEVAPHMTALECKRRVEAAGGPGHYVGRLAEAWTSAAYAGRLPSGEDVEALFDDWRRYFGGGER